MNFSESRLDRKTVLLLVCAVVCILSVTILMAVLLNKRKENSLSSGIVVEYPSNYSSDYSENAKALEDAMELETNWDSLPPEQEVFLTVQMSETVVGSTFSGTSTVKASNRTLSDEDIIMLSENEAWSLISNYLFNEYPTGSFNSNKTKLEEIKLYNTETIKVPIWYWEDPNDQTNFNKVTRYATFAVNSSIAQLFEHAFLDIYNDPSQPIINIGDGGMGTWVLRGKNHNNNASMSTHALGCAIDINPSTGSFKINGTWYGNGYGHKTMSSVVWEQLPECHEKYQVLYDGCPIVEIFKSYGFVWGGDFAGTKDCMHLSFIGEGKDCRSKGQDNYLARK